MSQSNSKNTTQTTGIANYYINMSAEQAIAELRKYGIDFSPKNS